MSKMFYLIVIAFLMSCSGRNEFWNINDFNLDDTALEDNEIVSVIYYCSGPFNEDDEENFYRHAIVISHNTKDTVNVLTFPGRDLDNLSNEDNELRYNDHPVVGDLLPGTDNASEKLREQLDAIDSSKISWGTYSKVARNPEFDYLADNDFKTVIGSLTKTPPLKSNYKEEELMNSIPENGHWADDEVTKYIQENETVLNKDKCLHLAWTISSTTRNGREYALVKIGHNDEYRFITEQVVFVDSLTNNLFEYDALNDSMILWE